MKVLVVEDELNILTYLKKGLGEAGYKVDTCEDGEDAVYMASINSYDLILLDVMIPKMNGLEVCKALRKEKNPAYIVLLSAKGEIGDKVAGLDAGADDYITKPFAFAELLARLRAVLRRNSDDKESIIAAKDLTVNLLNREIKYSCPRIVAATGKNMRQIVPIMTTIFFLLLSIIRNGMGINRVGARRAQQP